MRELKSRFARKQARENSALRKNVLEHMLRFRISQETSPSARGVVSESRCLELRESHPGSANYNLELEHFNLESAPNDHVIVECKIEVRGFGFESVPINHVNAECKIEFGRPWIEFGGN